MHLAARFPTSKIDNQFIDEVEKSVAEEMKCSSGEDLTNLDLLRSPGIRMVTFLVMYQWFATTLGKGFSLLYWEPIETLPFKVRRFFLFLTKNE